MLVRTAPGFHAKTILIDPTTQPGGMLLTANLIDVDLEANVEVAIELQAEEVRSLFSVLRWAFWEAAEHELTEPGRLHATTASDAVSWPGNTGSVLALSREADTLTPAILDAISGAGRVVVSNFGWDVNHPVVTALRAAAARGAEVIVLARSAIRARRSTAALLALAASGARVVGWDRLHAKVLEIDGGHCLVHTANYTSGQDPSSLEVGVWLEGGRAKAVSKILEQWVQSAPWTLVGEGRLDSVADRYVEVADGAWSEHVVVDEIAIALPAMEAESLLDLQAMPRLPAAPTSSDGTIARSTRYTWTVNAPRLKSGSRELFVEDLNGGEGRTPFAPKVYLERGRRRVVAVSDEAELRAARALAKKVDAEAVVVRPQAARSPDTRKRK